MVMVRVKVKVCNDRRTPKQRLHVTLVINFSLLEASIYLQTSGATRDTLPAMVEVVSWPAAVRAYLCCGKTSTLRRCLS